jgi:hypothetical protein
MKTGFIVLFTFATATALLAGYITPYDNTKTPALSLPKAYECALVALGSATNQFHCLSASVQTTFDTRGEWFFTFYSTNSSPKPKYVTVEFSGKIHIEDLLLR